MLKLSSSSPTQKSGKHYEVLALKYFKQQGLQLLEKNFNCRCGEIDLILKDHNSLVFAEVRFRKSTNYGSAAETVNYHKQQKLIKAAQFFLLKHRHYESFPCRFDVLGISLGKEKNTIDYHWLKNAFQC